MEWTGQMPNADGEGQDSSLDILQCRYQVGYQGSDCKMQWKWKDKDNITQPTWLNHQRRRESEGRPTRAQAGARTKDLNLNLNLKNTGPSPLVTYRSTTASFR
jgi:hypothetical protein